MQLGSSSYAAPFHDVHTGMLYACGQEYATLAPRGALAGQFIVCLPEAQ